MVKLAQYAKHHVPETHEKVKIKYIYIYIFIITKSNLKNFRKKKFIIK